jgi:pimeloyl-ACP methyl ester carboxylesterase
MRSRTESSGLFAEVNGLNMYYEIHGSGMPMVLIHGGGSTIDSTFGRLLSEFAKKRQVIAVELQAHGHTKDIDRPLSFEQDADDVAELLRQLKITKADFMGSSNGGTTCIQIGIRHAKLVNKLVLASATFKRDGMQPGFFDGFQQARLEMMPAALQQAYLRANPDPEGLKVMFDRDVARMAGFVDVADVDIDSIQAPTLVINGDSEVVLASHALELAKKLPRARLAILPSGHGDYIGEICTQGNRSKLPELVAIMIDEFLSAD